MGEKNVKKKTNLPMYRSFLAIPCMHVRKCLLIYFFLLIFSYKSNFITEIVKYWKFHFFHILLKPTIEQKSAIEQYI